MTSRQLIIKERSGISNEISSGNLQSKSDLIHYHDKQAAELGFEFLVDSSHGTNYTTLEGGEHGVTFYRVGSGDMSVLRNKIIPREKTKCIRRAQAWREEDDLIGDLVKIKTDFSLAGFNLQCSVNTSILDDVDVDQEIPDEIKDKVKAAYKEQMAFQRKLSNVQQKWDLRSVARTLFEDWHTTDSMILYWHVKLDQKKDSDQSSPLDSPIPGSKEDLLPNISNIIALSPGDVKWDDSLGQDRLKVKIPEEIKTRINQVMMKLTRSEQAEKAEELIKEGLHPKWIEAVLKKQDMVDLHREDGDNWIIKTRGRKHHGLAFPSMKRVFFPLESRRALTEGDYATAYMMKDFILHIKAGTDINQGPMAGTRNNWAKGKDLTGLQKQINTTSRSFRMYTNHTVEFTFVYPPEEMFDGKKYLKTETRIFNWAGITIQIMSGEGGTYATGFLGVKKLIASISDARSDVSWVLREFFDHPSLSMTLEQPDDCHVSAVFDDNVLKEPAQLLSELKFLVENHFGNPQQALRELGRNPEVYQRSSIEARKIQALLEIYSGLNAQDDGESNSTGNANGNPVGRPGNGSPQSPMSSVRSGSPVGNQTSG